MFMYSFRKLLSDHFCKVIHGSSGDSRYASVAQKKPLLRLVSNAFYVAQHRIYLRLAP